MKTRLEVKEELVLFVSEVVLRVEKGVVHRWDRHYQGMSTGRPEASAGTRQVSVVGALEGSKPVTEDTHTQAVAEDTHTQAVMCTCTS